MITLSFFFYYLALDYITLETFRGKLKELERRIWKAASLQEEIDLLKKHPHYLDKKDIEEIEANLRKAQQWLRPPLEEDFISKVHW